MIHPDTLVSTFAVSAIGDTRALDSLDLMHSLAMCQWRCFA